MLRLIRFIFTGDWHLHKWKQIERVSASNLKRINGTARLYGL